MRIDPIYTHAYVCIHVAAQVGTGCAGQLGHDMQTAKAPPVMHFLQCLKSLPQSFL